jgi:3-oxo-5alpha-steroid 4-dehydrogenase
MSTTEYRSVQPPLVVEDASAQQWDEEADVLVVGFGGAGVVAALQARELGASVLAVDRFAGGGTTWLSGGVIYAGATKYQRDSGFDDTAEEMFNYLKAEGTPLSDEALRRFCEGSAGDMEWLESHGVRYGSNAFVEKTNFPPDGHWIYYTGNEKSPVYSAQAKPAPRGHRVAVPGFGGKTYMETLQKTALSRGVKFLPHSPVTRLVTDSSGAVIGVEVNALPASTWQDRNAQWGKIDPWRPFNATRAEHAIAAVRKIEQGSTARRLLRAKRGVILSAGGFIFNLTMLNQHQPILGKHYTMLARLGSMGDDGSGIGLGESVGGTSDMDYIWVARTIAPPNIFPEGLIVNSEGKRFVSEAAYSSVLGQRIVEQPEQGRAWLILGAKQFWTAVHQSLFPGKGLFLLWGAPALLNIVMGGTKRARTMLALARACRVDSAGLERTVAEYNAMVVDRRADPFGKIQDLMVRLEDTAYYAVNVSLSNKFAPMPALSMGGLLVDENTGSVKRANGGTVTGLYAAGRTVVGVCSKSYMSGLSIADTVFSGRRAARAVLSD